MLLLLVYQIQVSELTEDNARLREAKQLLEKQAHLRVQKLLQKPASFLLNVHVKRTSSSKRDSE